MKSPDLVDTILTVQNDVAIVTLDRDDVRNALTGTAIIEDIISVCDWINKNREIGAMVLTGSGKAFSAGGNIKDMREKKGDIFGGQPIHQQDGYRHGIQRMSQALYKVEVPLVAAVNGPAVGAGLDVICMCDIRFGCQYSKVGETFVNLGLIPGDGGAWFLPRIVGYQRAAEMTFSGRLLSAEEAKEAGIFLELIAVESLLDRATEVAESYARKPREAIRMSKRLLRAGQRLELSDFLDLCASQQALCQTSPQHHEAVEALFKKS